MIAAAQALRDLGFTVDEADDEMGLLSGTTERDVSELSNDLIGFGILLLTGVEWEMPERERLTVSVVVSTGTRISVYAASQREVWTQNGLPMVNKTGRVEQAEFYQRLFDTMTTALFLEEAL